MKQSLTELVKAYGQEKAAAFYNELYTALNVSLKTVIERENIDSDFAISGRVVLARSPKQLEGVVNEFVLRQQPLGEDIQVLGRPELRREIACADAFCGGVLIPDMASPIPESTTQV